MFSCIPQCFSPVRKKPNYKKNKPVYWNGMMFDSPALEHIGERYELLSDLGKGSFGQVLKARDRKNNLYVAIKRITDIFSSARKATYALRETEILK